MLHLPQLRTLFALFSLTLLAACGDTSDDPSAAIHDRWSGPFPDAPNVLLIIADDYGVDSSPDYPHVEGSNERIIAETPNISNVCRNGVQFMSAWSMTTCSPTRASILTGRFGFRTGVGAPTPPAPAIPRDEVTIPRVLVEHAPYYAHANIGKWHLGVPSELAGNLAPNVMGWDYYAGWPGGHLDNYFEWKRIEQGGGDRVEDYATTRTVDDAIKWIDGRRPDEPWVMWLAFNAPHTPFHLPPEELHSFDLSGEDDHIDENEPAYYMAMVQAMDTEIGRLFAELDEDGDGLPDDTNVIFVGDNGTPRDATQRPYRKGHAKDSPYQGGVHVPLCIAGPSVVEGGRKVDSLVSTVDLFYTSLELAGVDPAHVAEDAPTIDSVSLVPYLTDPDGQRLRRWIYTEGFGGERKRRLSGRATRDLRYKYLRREDGTEEAYDLRTDPLEKRNLLEGDNLRPSMVRQLETLRLEMDDMLCSAKSRFCGL